MISGVACDFDSAWTEYMYKLVDFIRSECALFQFQSDIGFVKKAKDKSCMVDVLAKCLQEDYYVIKLHRGKLPFEWEQDNLHDKL